jgi:hypothetical protein
MPLNINRELAALQRLTLRELRCRYASLFGEPTQAVNKTWLIKRLCWRMQALAEGDLSERARQRAAELANDADLRMTAPQPPRTTTRTGMAAPATPAPAAPDPRLPAPGTILTRVYKGKTLQVQVLRQGFAFDGELYKSLSAVAKVITGAHCNGFLFFRVGRSGGVR